MGPIKNISGLPGNVNKAEKNTDYRKVESGKQQNKSESTSAASNKDRLEISPEARDMLSKNVEASDPQFIKEVIDAETLDASELSVIKNRVQEDFYSNPEVVDKIVQKLFESSEFTSKTPRFDE